MNFNMYVDGSWLFKQCGAEGLLSSRTEYPSNRFRLDFSRLLDVVGEQLSARLNGEAIERGELYYYTALFSIPEEIDEDWPDTTVITRSTNARQRFVDEALAAGFLDCGIFKVPLRRWMVEKLAQQRYQEKMVDTSLVAR
ncbi:MAG: hypothetical protein AB7K71_36865, partial [Polyangiaceae bacterium]